MYTHTLISAVAARSVRGREGLAVLPRRIVAPESWGCLEEARGQRTLFVQGAPCLDIPVLLIYGIAGARSRGESATQDMI